VLFVTLILQLQTKPHRCLASSGLFTFLSLHHSLKLTNVLKYKGKYYLNFLCSEFEFCCLELTFLTHHHHVISLSPFTLQQINVRFSCTNFQFSPPHSFAVNCLRYVKNTQVRDPHRYIPLHLLAYVISECVTHGKCSF
jgi:hypothetical protein